MEEVKVYINLTNVGTALGSLQNITMFSNNFPLGVL